MPERSEGLQIDEAFPIQTRIWRIQRAAWVVLLLLLIAAVAGVFGGGPLADATVSSSDERVEVRYTRFGRYMTPQLLEFRFVNAQHPPTVWISRELIDRMRVSSVFPEPEGALIDDMGVTYRFSAAALQSGGRSPAVTFEITPDRPGMLRGSLGATREGAVSVWQFVYP